jgi:hypothetical protein
MAPVRVGGLHGEAGYPVLRADQQVAAFVKVRDRNNMINRMIAVPAERPEDVLAVDDRLAQPGWRRAWWRTTGVNERAIQVDQLSVRTVGADPAYLLGGHSLKIESAGSHLPEELRWVHLRGGDHVGEHVTIRPPATQ